MNLLALETATSTCSAALLCDGRVTAELSIHRPRTHAEFLVPLIEEVLRFGGAEKTEVDGVAVSSGPGSYTGLRIGVSTAKGFASAVGAELVSVPSLQALAEVARPFADRNDHIAAAFDARRDEVYAALFRIDRDGGLFTVRDTAALRADEVPAWIDLDRSGALYAVGDGWQKMSGMLGAPNVRVLANRVVRPAAGAVARLGAAKLERGEVENAVTFEPYYLKEFVASKPASSAFEKLSF